MLIVKFRYIRGSFIEKFCSEINNVGSGEKREQLKKRNKSKTSKKRHNKNSSKNMISNMFWRRKND